MRKILLLLSAAVSAHAGVIYSTDGTLSPGFSTGAGWGGPGQAANIAMRFVAVASGVVSEYAAPLSAFSDSLVMFQLFTDVADSPGLVLDSLTFSVTTTPTLLTANSALDPVLSAGTAYWLISGWTSQQTVLWFDSSPAVDGTVWVNSIGVETGQRLAAFAIQGGPTVPESATALLVGLAFLTCMIYRRKVQFHWK